MPEEKGFRIVPCSCGKRLRIKVTEAQYGKRVRVNCPCGEKLETTIPHPAPEPAAAPDELAEFSKLLDKMLKGF